MAGCVLRAWGDDFAPEEFLRHSSLEPCNVFRKGARKSEDHTWNTSGLTVVVSESNDFARQVVDAVVFLKSNREDLSHLKGSVGVEGTSLDFGVNGRDGFLQSYYFPPELIHLAAEFSMALDLSIYNLLPEAGS